MASRFLAQGTTKRCIKQVFVCLVTDCALVGSHPIMSPGRGQGFASEHQTPIVQLRLGLNAGLGQGLENALTWKKHFSRKRTQRSQR